MTSSVTVKCSGPLFDGTAERALERGTTAVRRHLASVGENLVRAAFGASIRENTGHFLSQVTSIDDSKVFVTVSHGKAYIMPIIVDRSTDTIVTADLATYGPWLEGTGSRNLTTRFKGYHGFRRTAQALDRTATGIAESVLRPYVREMND